MTSSNPYPAATIHELSQTVRDTIFDPLVEHIFLESDSLRYQVASCLDTIEDAQMAIDVFRLLDPSSDQTDKGSLYLAIYGVFQGVILQQDALMNLAKALSFPFKIADSPVLEEVRGIRNRIVGHPTSYKRKKTESYYAINRSSLSLEKMDVMEYRQDGQGQVTSVDITRTLCDNESLISQALRELNSSLQSQIADHKAKFRDKPLTKIFPDSLEYLLGKISAGASDSKGFDHTLAVAALVSVEKLLCDVEKALSERGQPPQSDQGISLLWHELQYPMKELRAFFSEDNDIQKPDPEAAHIFTWYLQTKLRELRNMCQEIDEYYGGDEAP